MAEIESEDKVWTTWLPLDLSTVEGDYVTFGGEQHEANYDGVPAKNILTINKKLWEIVGKPDGICVAFSVSDDFLQLKEQDPRCMARVGRDRGLQCLLPEGHEGNHKHRTTEWNYDSHPDLTTKVCWSGPTYSHPPHNWIEDRPKGKEFHCPGAATDRT